MEKWLLSRDGKPEWAIVGCVQPWNSKSMRPNPVAFLLSSLPGLHPACRAPKSPWDLRKCIWPPWSSASFPNGKWHGYIRLLIFCTAFPTKVTPHWLPVQGLRRWKGWHHRGQQRSLLKEKDSVALIFCSNNSNHISLCAWELESFIKRKKNQDCFSHRNTDSESCIGWKLEPGHSYCSCASWLPLLWQNIQQYQLWGGKVSLAHRFCPGSLGYVSVGLSQNRFTAGRTR